MFLIAAILSHPVHSCNIQNMHASNQLLLRLSHAENDKSCNGRIKRIIFHFYKQFFSKLLRTIKDFYT